MVAQVSACSRATLTASKPERRLTLQVNNTKDPDNVMLFNSRPSSEYSNVSIKHVQRDHVVAKVL